MLFPIAKYSLYLKEIYDTDIRGHRSEVVVKLLKVTTFISELALQVGSETYLRSQIIRRKSFSTFEIGACRRVTLVLTVTEMLT